MGRNEIILAIIKLHNFHLGKHFEVMNLNGTPDFWSLEQFQFQPDRYYLTETVHELDSVEEKKFYPKVELRFHLLRRKHNKYGKGFSCYYDGYKSTIAFSYDEINNIEKTMEDISMSYFKLKNKQ
jgi:hypothetical protein